MEHIIARAMVLANQLLLAQIYFESVPQFLTQLVMASAEAEEGQREMSSLQIVSICGSAFTTVFGLSMFMTTEESCDGTGNCDEKKKVNRGCPNENLSRDYYSRSHLPLTSRIIIVTLTSSALAFYGGVARFSFAFPKPYFVLFFIAFCFFFYALFQRQQLEKEIQQSNKDNHTEDIAKWSKVIPITFAVLQIVTFISIITTLFLIGYKKCLQELKTNGSLTFFFFTITLSFIVNVTLGYVVFGYGLKGKCFKWTDALLIKLGKVAINAISQVIQIPALAEEKEKSQVYLIYSSNCSIETAIENVQYEEGEARAPESCETNPIRKASQFSKMEENMIHNNLKSCLFGTVLPVAIKVLVLSIITTLLVFLGNYEYFGFHVQFQSKFDLQGHPLVSFSQFSQKGSICIIDRNDKEITDILRVVVKNVTMESAVTHERTVMVFHNVSSVNEEVAFKNIFLHPNCRGDEMNLTDCSHKGLGVGIPLDCGIHPVANILNFVLLNHEYRGYAFHFHSTETSVFEAYKLCHREGGY